MKLKNALSTLWIKINMKLRELKNGSRFVYGGVTFKRIRRHSADNGTYLCKINGTESLVFIDEEVLVEAAIDIFD